MVICGFVAGEYIDTRTALYNFQGSPLFLTVCKSVSAHAVLTALLSKRSRVIAFAIAKDSGAPRRE